MLKALDEWGIDALHKIIDQIYECGEIPEELSKSVFIAMPKKPGAIDCDQFRTISLMSHVTKILIKIIQQRIKHRIHPEIAEQQYGFMPDKGTRNATFVLRMLSERQIEMQQDLYLCFIDYKKRLLTE